MNRGKRVGINPVDDACDIKDSWYKFLNNSHTRIIKDMFGNMKIIGVDIAKPKRNILKKLFDKWNVIDYCPKCGCRETRSITKDTINYTVCEEEIRCAKCDYLLDYWAYGNYSSIYKRTEQLRFIWDGTILMSRRDFYEGRISVIKLIKRIFSNIKLSLHYIFNTDILGI